MAKTICETELSLAELAETLKRMPNNKTPGSDGFSTEFYNFFWIDIQHIVYKSFVSAEQNGKLSIEQRRGILSLIPKPNKDLRQLSSWRPLSLLNTDYKILTKVLANRLQIVINNLVAFDQSGYIKGRFIGTNIRTMADLIEYSNNTHESGIIALLDFEKAFDTVKWSYMQRVLETMNFGPKFRRWISIIYKDITSCCMNNGYTT
jgi:hypothetical protein